MKYLYYFCNIIIVLTYICIITLISTFVAGIYFSDNIIILSSLGGIVFGFIVLLMYRYATKLLKEIE